MSSFLKKLGKIFLCLALLSSSVITSGAAPQNDYMDKIEGNLYEFMDSDEMVPITIKLKSELVKTPYEELIEIRDQHMVAIDQTRDEIKKINLKYAPSIDSKIEDIMIISEADKQRRNDLGIQLDDQRTLMRRSVALKEEEQAVGISKPIIELVESLGGRVISHTAAVAGYIFTEIPGKAIGLLAKNGDIERVVHNPPITFEVQMDTSAYAVWTDYLWGYDDTNADVAILDTGVKANHPALARCYDGSQRTWLQRNFYNFGQSGYNPNDYTDHQGHGTHVAGTVALGDTSGTTVPGGRPLRGVASNIRTMINARCGSPTGTFSMTDAIEAMYWATGSASQGNTISDSAEVLNLSFGSSFTGSEAIQPINHITQTRAVLFVCAAGNGWFDQVSHPGDAHNSIQVGAMTDRETYSQAHYEQDDKIWRDPLWWLNFKGSSFGPTGSPYVGRHKPDIVAPGCDVWSTAGSSSYSKKTGTSMASPHVAAAAAMLMGQEGGLSAMEAKAVLINCARKYIPGGEPWDIRELIWEDKWDQDWEIWDERIGFGYMYLHDAAMYANWTQRHSVIDRHWIAFEGDMGVDDTITVVHNTGWGIPVSDVDIYLYNWWDDLADQDVGNDEDTVQQVYTPDALDDAELWIYVDTAVWYTELLAISFPNSTWTKIQ